MVIPWFDGDRLALVKIRQPEGREAEVRAKRSATGPGSFPTPPSSSPAARWSSWKANLTPCLLGQELRDLAAVVTLGSASSRPTWHLVDDAGRRPVVHRDRCRRGRRQGRLGLARPRRSRPAAGAFKDWTEAAQAGVNLRRWWSDRLGGTEARPCGTRTGLASKRWGPARMNARPPKMCPTPMPSRNGRRSKRSRNPTRKRTWQISPSRQALALRLHGGIPIATDQVTRIIIPASWARYLR